METFSLEEQRLLQAELSTGETVLWTGKPNPRIHFHPSDWGVIPFSLAWAGFAIFWECGVTGRFPMGSHHGDPSLFMILWGIPFVVIGQYMVWGRFLYVAWKKPKVLYALTNQRVLTLVSPPQPKTISTFLRAIPGVNKELRSDGAGTLKFGETPPLWGSRSSQKAGELFLKLDTPVFVDIVDAAAVAERITQAAAQSR